MSKHTQGKYTIHPLSGFNEGLGFTILKQSDGEDTCYIADVYGSDKEAKNLATLFASAPEMLELIKTIKPLLKDIIWKSQQNLSFEDYANQLIAKAEGGAK